MPDLLETLRARGFVHDSTTFDDHTEMPSGDMDSKSVRVTFAPSDNISLQASRGTLGEDSLELEAVSPADVPGHLRALARDMEKTVSEMEDRLPAITREQNKARG